MSPEPERVALDSESWILHHPAWIEAEPAERLREALMQECAFERRSIVMFGKEVMQPREIAWAGDRPYAYSGRALPARAWGPRLRELLRQVCDAVDHEFNHVLLNYYRDGRDSMGAHSDDESELGERPVVASVSFGATRRLLVKAKACDPNARAELHRFELAHGDLLVMGGATQERFKHSVPKTARPVAPRLSATFRSLVRGRGARRL